jgi:hypothetical protein
MTQRWSQAVEFDYLQGNNIEMTMSNWERNIHKKRRAM